MPSLTDVEQSVLVRGKRLHVLCLKADRKPSVREAVETGADDHAVRVGVQTHPHPLPIHCGFSDPLMVHRGNCGQYAVTQHSFPQ